MQKTQMFVVLKKMYFAKMQSILEFNSLCNGGLVFGLKLILDTSPAYSKNDAC